MSNLQANDDSDLDDDDQEMQADEIGTNENLSIEEEKPLSKYKSKVIIPKWIFTYLFLFVSIFSFLKKGAL